MRKKLADAEMKTARTAHDVCFVSIVFGGLLTVIKLNKEISELEALVESKVRVSVYLFI